MSETGIYNYELYTEILRAVDRDVNPEDFWKTGRDLILKALNAGSEIEDRKDMQATGLAFLNLCRELFSEEISFDKTKHFERIMTE